VFTLQPLRDIHLHSDLLFELGPNGNAQTVYVLALLALFILVIAWVNYVNLATARALERAREIGVRKVVGARQAQLVGQFLLEALLLNLLAGVLAFGLTQLLLPVFNDLTGKPLRLDLARDGRLGLALFGLFGAGTLLAGLYPAFVLSSFQPLSVLKGTLGRARHGLLLRKGLVVAQFAATIALVSGTLVIAKQVAYMERQNPGIDIAQTLVVNTPGTVGGNAGYAAQFESFKQALRVHPRIRSAAAASEIPGEQNYWVNSALRVGAANERRTSLYVVAVDYDYLRAYDHRLVAGRFLSEAYPADARSVVLNETAVRVLELGAPEEALAERLQVGEDTLVVVGVVADHHQQGLQRAHYQMAFRVVPAEFRFFSVKVETDDLAGTIAFVERTYRTFFADTPFSYAFLDARFDEQYRVYRQFGRIVSLFAGLATVVACLGLLGLSVLSTAQRTREIGIRKVLGAGVPGLLALLSRDLLKLVLLGGLLAVPVAWYALDRWLADFAFRIGLHPGPFLWAALGTLFVALVSVGTQTLRAALSNPVSSLRTE
jgi:putative ABC transport system permease protein